MARKTAEEAAATRRRLIGAGRALIVEHGYAAVPAEDIVHAAGVTRGAMYHHFADKRDLFEAIYLEALETFEQRVGAEAVAVAERTGDLWEAFIAALRTGLDLCLDREIARIVLLEAPVALGWRRWEEIDYEHSVHLLDGMLQLLIATGDLAEQATEPLARVLVGAFNQVGRAIAAAERPKAARVEYGRSLEAVVNGLRQPKPEAG